MSEKPPVYASAQSHTNARLSLASLLILTLGLFLQLGHYHSKNGVVIEYKRTGVGISNAYSDTQLSDLRKKQLETTKWLGTEDGTDGTVKYNDAICKHGQGGESIVAIQKRTTLIGTTFVANTDENPCGLPTAKLGAITEEAEAGCGFAAGIAADTSPLKSSIAAIATGTEEEAKEASTILQAWPYSCILLTKAKLTAAHNKAHDRANGMVHECSIRANGGPMYTDGGGISLLVSPSEISVKHLDGCKGGFDHRDKVNHDDAYCDVIHIPTPKEMSGMRFVSTQLQQILPCPTKSTIGSISTGEPDCPEDVNKELEGFSSGPNRNGHAYASCQNERFDSDSCDNAARFLKDQAAAMALLMALMALACKAFALLIFVADNDSLDTDGFGISQYSNANAFQGYAGLKACAGWTGTVLSICYALFAMSAFITYVVTLTTVTAFTDSSGECFGKYLRDLGYHETQTSSAGYTTFGIIVTLCYALACAAEIVNLAKHSMNRS